MIPLKYLGGIVGITGYLEGDKSSTRGIPSYSRNYPLSEIELFVRTGEVEKDRMDWGHPSLRENPGSYRQVFRRVRSE